MRKLTLLVLCLALPASAQAAKPYDLNGDRRQDLVIGLPGWMDSAGGEAAALVALGSKRALVGAPRLITRSALRMPATNWQAMLGSSVSSGDFDRDGKADLVLGAPNLGEYENERYEARGAVVVAYGRRPFGISRTTIVREDIGDTGHTPYGESTLAGDLDRDGADDLVVGPFILRVYAGIGGEGVSQSTTSQIQPPPDAERDFGFLIGLGDVTDDRRLDVLEGAPGEPESTDGEPHVHGHLAAAYGPDTQAQWVAPEMEGGPTSLALGDFDGDGYRDLLAGVPVDNFFVEDDPTPVGHIEIRWGGPNGLSLEPTTITQDSPGIPGSGEEGDGFGSVVAAGRLDRDRYADIVVSAPFEDGLRGRVTIIRGGPAGYSRKGNRAFGFATKGVPGSYGNRDRAFGFGMTVLDFTGDGRPELAVANEGFPRPDGTDRRGGVSIFRGTKRGITLKGARRIEFTARGAQRGDNASFPRLGRADSSG